MPQIITRSGCAGTRVNLKMMGTTDIFKQCIMNFIKLSKIFENGGKLINTPVKNSFSKAINFRKEYEKEKILQKQF